MCISVNESLASNTHVYNGHGIYDSRDVHVLAYQCNVDVRDPSGRGAMILPIPASEPLTENNFMDTFRYPSFLQDISNASRKMETVRGDFPMSFSIVDDDVLVVDRGATTYVYAPNFEAAANAMNRVPAERRANFSEEFIKGCSTLYDEPITIACWAGNIQTEPLLLWYIPQDKSIFRLPTMDAHNGKAPSLESRAEMDHVLSVSAGIGLGYRVKYTEIIPENVRGLLPQRVHGVGMYGRFKNGDMFVQSNESLTKNQPFIRRAISVNADSIVQGPMDGWN